MKRKQISVLNELLNDTSLSSLLIVRQRRIILCRIPISKIRDATRETFKSYKRQTTYEFETFLFSKHSRNET